MKKKSSSGAIFKVLHIFDVFSQTDKPVGVTELSKLTHLNISTVHRIANILAEHGYLQKEKNKYTIGLQFLKFNRILMNKLNVRDVAYPYMEKLRTVSGESTNLAILDGSEAVYIEHIDSNYLLRTFTALGSRVPLYCTGVGKVLCAHMDEEALYRLMPRPLSRFTENTITDFMQLVKEINKVKIEGVALDNGEMDVNIRCIASPIMDSTGKIIAAVSISGPFTRISEPRIEELKQFVKKYAMQISSAMGYESHLIKAPRV